LTASLLANAPAGAKPIVAGMMWKDGFAVGTCTFRTITPALRVKNYKPALEQGGKKWPWGVEEVELAEDEKTLLRIVKRILFKTESQADAAFKKWLVEIRAREAKAKATQAAADARKPSGDEQDLAQARLKLMREQYPDTFKAMDTLAQAQPEARPGAVEAVLRAYAVDMVRLHKPAKLGEVTPFDSLPADVGLLVEIAKAYKAKSPYDAVDEEIAARWFAAGYDTMSLADYTRAINAKTGAKLLPDAMKARRLKKFRLLSARPEGCPPKS